MKAAIYERYGPADVLEVREVNRPEIGDDEVLVKVIASTVSTGDWRLRAAEAPGIMRLMLRAIYGVFAPKNPILGHSFAGRVVARGANVTRFRLGDPVFGLASGGAHAEYLKIAADGAIVPKPAAIGYEEAAATPFGGLAALVFLRDFARVAPGQRVLVVGASGGVGSFLVQVAKHFGAHVTGVTSTANVELVKSLGADRVIDYKHEDFTATGEVWDAVIDPVGKSSFGRVRRVLSPQGVYVPIEFAVREIVQALLTGMGKGRKVLIGINGDRQEDLAYLAGLLATGELTPVIDSVYPLDRIADAHRRVETRHKTGAVIVDVDLEAGRNRLAA